MIIQKEEIELTKSELSISQIDLLHTLVQDQLINQKENQFVLPIENYYALGNFAIRWLNLPELFEGTIRIRLNGGGLLIKESKLELDFYSDSSKHLDFSLKGLFLYEYNSKTPKYILPEEFVECNNTIKEYNALSDKKHDNQGFALFAKLKAKSNHDFIIFDEVLSSQEMLYPQQIKLEVEVNDDNSISLSASISESEEFKNHFESKSKVKDHYFYRNQKGSKTRVLFDSNSKEVKNELHSIKAKQSYSGEEIRSLVKNPDSIFNSNYVDLSSLFSDRVLGMEIFNPPATPVINQIKSNWVPGFQISDEFIYVSDEYEYQLLKSSYQIAFEEELKTVSFKGKFFDLDSVKSVLSVSKLIYEEKLPSNEILEETIPKEFLIVKDNLEELSFQAETDDQGKVDFTLEPAYNFNPEFNLKTHQEEGIAWLQTTYFKQKSSGVLLADDMGLGKTLQILYFLESIVHQTNTIKSSLIVCPSSLIENWFQEYDRFFPQQSYEKAILKGRVAPFLKRLRDGDVEKPYICITTYETMRKNAIGFCTVDWRIVTLDEAQKIKNPSTLITHCAKGLKSDFKIAMTGTPVENQLLDLWCIMDFCVPGILGSAKLFTRNIQNEELDSDKIREIINSKFLRRLKSDVAKDLPSKNEHFVAMEMSGQQLEMYNNVLNQLADLNNKELLKGSVMLKAIHEMRSLSDHTELVRSDHDLDLSKINQPAKVRIVLNLLNEIKKKKEKVIIFSEKRKMQFILSQIIFEQFSLKPFVINGDTPSTVTKNVSLATRQNLVDQFQSENGFNVIIMSPLAAGFGLNVTKANHVIHYSRHWNPAKEQQATDRAYRIGQTLDVHVYYPFATLPSKKSSFDQILNDRLVQKKSLSDDIMFPSERIDVTNTDLMKDLLNNETELSNK